MVLLFLEGMKDGERLREVARAATARGVQLVALKGGETRRGQEATASHTGKIASPQKVYSDIFRQCGVIEVATFTELVQASEVLTSAPPLPRFPGSSGLGVIGLSGGSRCLIADACGRYGVPLADLSAETEATLREIIPSYGYPRNPVDPTGQVIMLPGVLEKTIRLVARDPSTEALLLQHGNRGAGQLEEMADFWCGLPAECGKPVVLGLLAEPVDEDVRRRLREHGVLCAMDPDEAVRYVSWMHRRREARGESRGARSEKQEVTSKRRQVRGESQESRAESQRPTGAAPLTLDSRLSPLSTLSTWRDQVQVLESCGIGVPGWAIVHDAEDLPALAFPVAAKALPEDAQHKTELGLVRIGLRSPEELSHAVAELQAKLGAGRPVLVQEMVRGGVEALLAVRRDPDFGAVLAIGAGGTLVELVKDVVYLSAPVEEHEVRAALERLETLSPLLSGYRGEKPRDLAALARAASALSHACLALGAGVREIELNPLFVLEEGRGVVAVDVLVTEGRTED